jgi:K+-sensing histidine kinase KdpD
MDRIFRPLFTTKARGMGMGLSICRSIIESHNGRIWVSAGSSGGSIFQFDLLTTIERSFGTSAILDQMALETARPEPASQTVSAE